MLPVLTFTDIDNQYFKKCRHIGLLYKSVNRYAIPVVTHLSSMLICACSILSITCGSWASSSNAAPQPSTRAKSLPVPRGRIPTWHWNKRKMQLDFDMSPPANIMTYRLTLTHGSFDIDPCDPWPPTSPVSLSNEVWNYVFNLVTLTFEL